MTPKSKIQNPKYAIALVWAVGLMLAAYALAVDAWWVGDDYNYVVPKDWAAVALAAGSMLGKESAVVLPLLALWSELLLGRGWARGPNREGAGWWRTGTGWRKLAGDYAPLFVVSMVYIALRGGLILAGLG